MEVWSAGCDGGRTVLPDRCHAVCTAAAGSGQPCDTTRNFSGPGTSVVTLHTHDCARDYQWLCDCLFMLQKLEAWETVSEMVAEVTEMVGLIRFYEFQLISI